MNFKHTALLIGFLMTSPAMADDSVTITRNVPYKTQINAEQGSSFLKDGKNNFKCNTNQAGTLNFTPTPSADGSTLMLEIVGNFVTGEKSLPTVYCAYDPKGTGTKFYNQSFIVVE